MIYTYFPPFLRTDLHPSQSFFTDVRTFMPRVWVTHIELATAVERCDDREADVRERRASDDVSARLGRDGLAVVRYRVQVVVVRRDGERRSVRRAGRSSVRGSIVAINGVCVLCDSD